MTRARKELIAVEDTPFYHCISRCVRRAYLCGDDFQTKQNFDHRKQWLVDRSKFLASVFSIDICAYAIMSNHYHLVLFINQEQSKTWSEEEVVERWGRLFPVSAKHLKSLIENAESKVDLEVHRKKIEEWRGNLSSISWFMRALNEHIARMANKEEKCSGRFWEGRFKSQALLDEKAILSCMAYVDLNPIRAKMAATPEESDFTSIQERLFTHAKRVSKPSKAQNKLIKNYQNRVVNLRDKKLKQAKLKPLNGSCHAPLSKGLPYTQQDYFDLVDWTGRAVRKGKRGAIEKGYPPILDRLGIEEESWVDSVRHFQRYFFDAAGTVSSLEEYHARVNGDRAGKEKESAPLGWIRGKGASLKLYG